MAEGHRYKALARLQSSAPAIAPFISPDGVEYLVDSWSLTCTVIFPRRVGKVIVVCVFPRNGYPSPSMFAIVFIQNAMVILVENISFLYLFLVVAMYNL